MHLSRLFQRSVARHGDRPALAVGTAPALTYAGLARQVEALAHWLRTDLGLVAGDRATLVMHNSTGYATLMLALWRAGLCAVPANARLHPKEMQHVLVDSGSRACFCDAGLREALAPVVDGLGEVRLVDIDGPDFAAALHHTPPPAASDDAALADDAQTPAWLFYTSGTTGRPKGVVLAHAQLVAMALDFQADVQALAPDDVIVHAAPLSHGSGLYALPYWMAGALQVIPASGGFDEAEVLALCRHYHRTSLFAAPTMLNRLVAHARAQADTADGLRCIVVGGAPFYVEDAKQAVACLGPRVAQIYGQGESPMTITAMTAQALGRAVADGDDEALASVGWPQTSVDVIVGEAPGRPLPPGALGEVMVRGATVMTGYWRNPAASAETLAGGWLHTGDVGLFDPRGRLHLKDRSKDVVISGGSNIYPREVEEVLLRHPAVAEAAVIGVPDAAWGEAVLAFVVRRPGQDCDATALDTWCLAEIARFKRPKAYRFVDALPKNPTGKVLKSSLRALANAASAPSDDPAP